jgi:hypothetical protein
VKPKTQLPNELEHLTLEMIPKEMKTHGKAVEEYRK